MSCGSCKVNSVSSYGGYPVPIRVIYLHSGDNRGDYLRYYSHANQNLLLKWTLTRIRATIIPTIIVAMIAGIIAGIMVLLPA